MDRSINMKWLWSFFKKEKPVIDYEDEFLQWCKENDLEPNSFFITFLNLKKVI